MEAEDATGLVRQRGKTSRMVRRSGKMVVLLDWTALKEDNSIE
jgi:hypothetical protein